MQTKLELPTVVRQVQGAKISTEDRLRLLAKATAANSETELIEVQSEVFKLGGGAVGMKQNKLGAVPNTR